MKNKFNFSRRNPKTKKIENTGFMEFRNVSNNAADLYIYGDIVSSTWEAWCDEDTCPQDISDFMNQIEPGAELTVYINSGGGDVFAGIAIHSILSRHLEVRDSIMDTEAKQALYTRQQFIDMMDVIVEMYGNQFTTDDMLDAETGMTPDSIVMEFALMDVSVGEKVDKRTEDFAKNFTNGK